MLNVPKSLFTKVGAFEIMKTNLTNLPVEILPAQSLLFPASGKTIDSVGVNTLTPNKFSTFSISLEVTKSSWATPLSEVELFTWMDEAAENGVRIYQATSTGYLTVDFLDATSKTLTMTYDISGADSGAHNLILTRESGTSQKLYWDGVLVDSDTDASDTIGTPTDVTATITGISKAASAEITTSGAHGLSSDATVVLTDIVGSQTQNSRANMGMVSLNNKPLTITVTAANKFTVPIDSTNFDTYGSGGTVTFTPEYIVSYLEDSTNMLFTANILDANDAEILYQMVRNNLVVRNEAGLIKVVTIS
jgi:hypothetical protein